MSIAEIFEWSSIILFIGLIQANLENLILCFRYPAINNYPFKGTAFANPYNNWLSFGFDSPGIWVIYVLKLIVSLIMLVQVFFYSLSWYLPLFYLFIEFLGFNRQYFLHMSDSPIIKVLLISLGIHHGFQDEQLSELSIYFIAAQIGLAYFAAGFHKTKSEFWHDGLSIKLLFRRSFDKRYHNFFNKNKVYWKYLGWSTIAFELLFPLSFLGGYLNALILLTGIIFHGFLSLGIGINFFFWTFVACYPAVYYVGEQLNQHLF